MIPPSDGPVEVFVDIFIFEVHGFKKNCSARALKKVTGIFFPVELVNARILCESPTYFSEISPSVYLTFLTLLLDAYLRHCFHN